MIKFIIDIEKQKRGEDFDFYASSILEILPTIEDDCIVFVFDNKEQYKINKNDIKQLIKILSEII